MAAHVPNGQLHWPVSLDDSPGLYRTHHRSSDRPRILPNRSTLGRPLKSTIHDIISRRLNRSLPPWLYKGLKVLSSETRRCLNFVMSTRSTIPLSRKLFWKCREELFESHDYYLPASMSRRAWVNLGGSSIVRLLFPPREV